MHNVSRYDDSPKSRTSRLYHKTDGIKTTKVAPSVNFHNIRVHCVYNLLYFVSCIEWCGQ